MLDHEKATIVEKILSGVVFFRTQEAIYKITSPTRETRGLADFLANEASQDLNFSQLITKEELKETLNSKGIWTYEDDRKLKASEDTIEEIQISVYKNFFNSKAKNSLKRRLDGLRKAISQAHERKGSLDSVTLESYFDFIKERFIIGMSLYDINNTKIYDADTFFQQDALMLDKAYDAWISQYAIIPHLREVARTNPWKSYWDSCQNTSVFGVGTLDLNLFQRNVILFSKMYENARQSPESPPDEVFEDDDAFDGWMAVQRKEADKNRAKNNADKISGQKGDEIFMVTSKEDKDKVFNLNDHNERMSIKNKLSEVRSAGGEEIRESQLSDVKMRLQKELAEMVTNR
tara:strand:+ start:11270 stop:12310 length:1041 start_codon:yes stop_codon:yes gene_type:complete